MEKIKFPKQKKDRPFPKNAAFVFPASYLKKYSSHIKNFYISRKFRQFWVI